ncbi:8-amino-7-oxononanoate synthase [Aneurinibacillus sp. Ricciae_BoGa-3]|uniref:8-amino-7-oxononanoate synthase n=1 Tax=Aneurinibacillus sp. Ricciae_BoGa-3 TaxID=3022697 RepID=UPI0023426B32|nr:8-amino-7-oxononanoate synthase [Aneurinibacillus sp. Ricciae_BoGa-3]WCK55275.1 8-amino-7-oxononanoate synthase [Aneurinibacillus sp. Ricciae_BoGa-3]
MKLHEELNELTKNGLYRKLRRMESAASNRVIVEGHEMLMFASNNYLGLADDHRLIRAACQAIERYGTGSSGSRLTTGNTLLHEQLEGRLAQFKGTEAAIVFNTGYMANIAALTSLVGEGDVILSDALNHASIIDGCRLSRARTVIYRHADMQDLENKLKESTSFRQRLIVTDGVFSMDGDIAPLPDIVSLAEKYQATIMVDDAHATGVLGNNGTGTAEHFGLKDRIAVQLGTLSKALGAEGGYIAGKQELIDYLLNRARPFIFSTALSPGVIASALEALDIVELEPERRWRLHHVSSYARQELSRLGFHVLDGQTPILAVVIGVADAAVTFSKRLEDNGIFAPAIRPPTVPIGSSRIRITLMASHTDEDIQSLIQSFQLVGKELGVMR